MAQQNQLPGNNSQATAQATNQASSTNPTTGNATSTQAQPKAAKPSQQDDLIALALQDFVLFHSPDGEAYAKVIVNNSRLIMPIKSDEFKKFLGFKYHQSHTKVAHRQGLEDAIQLLVGKAIFESPEEEVFIRTAPSGGNIIVDLSNNQGQAVEISPSGWQIITNPPVNFLRLQSQRPMPLPLPGGTLDDFRPFINAQTKEDFIMTMAFLIFALHPRGPYPALVVNGDSGSCKSSGVHMLKNIVDPCTSVNFTMPKNVRDVFINASQTWLVTFDNLSEIPKWLSNCFCRISTGASHGTKKNYTDGDEYQISVKRPIILAGIGDLITRGDLASRAINVRRKSIENTPAMKTEDEIWEQFNIKHPYLAGWIFDALSAGLRNLNLINENYPRMADFTRFLTAADREIWTTGTFNKSYHSNIAKVVEQVIQADPVASSVLALMQNNTDCKGTATEALRALSTYVTDIRLLRSSEWPQAPNKLKGFLERSQSYLKKEGIEMQFDIYENGRKVLRIYRPNIQLPKTIDAPAVDRVEHVEEVKLLPEESAYTYQSVFEEE